MIYLASPYNHIDKSIMERRFHLAAAVVAKTMQEKILIYSPIVHNHYLACNFDLPRDWSFWQYFDIPMLEKAEEVWVLTLLGWEVSHGVSEELKHARKINIPVKFISLEAILGPDY